MKIIIDAQLVSDTLKIITSIAPPMSGNVIIQVDGEGKTHLISIGETNRCQLMLPCESEGEGEFALPLTTLSIATSNRGTLSLDVRNNVLTIRSGTYETVLATVDVLIEDGFEPDKEKGTLIEQHQAAWLRDALSDVYLKANTSISADVSMSVAVKISDSSATVVAYDMNRMAYTFSNDISGDIEMTLPHHILSAVFNTFGVSDFYWSVEQNLLCVWNSVGIATLSLPVHRLQLPIDQVIARIQNTDKPLAIWKFDPDDILAFIRNSKAVMEDGIRSPIRVEIDSKSSKLVVATSMGSSSVRIRCKANVQTEIGIDHGYFEELLAKNIDTLHIFDRYIKGVDEGFGIQLGLYQ